VGLIEGVQITPVKIIENPSGNIMHALKQHEKSFAGFGEAYFSTILCDSVKGWKKHRQMVLNIVVPVGSIQFVLFDGRPGSKSYLEMQEMQLSPANYQRLTVPPGVWMAFKGQSQGLNMLLNIGSIPHDPAEADNLPLKNDLINYPPFLI
jgi:dTDP-4-dehydrorhamnose 3,5-epimerase